MTQPADDAALIRSALRFVHVEPDHDKALAALDRLTARIAELEAAATGDTDMSDNTPTDEELAALIKPLWRAAKPGVEAQTIRASLYVAFDDPRFRQRAADFIPDYVWDLVDIAAQRGIEAGRE